MGAQPSRFSVVTASSASVKRQNNDNTAESTDYVLENRDSDGSGNSKRSSRLRALFAKKNQDASATTTTQSYILTKVAFISLVSLTIVAWIVYLVLFGQAISFSQNDEEEGGGPDEERAMFLNSKLTFCMVWMLLVSQSLIVLGCINFWSGVANTIPSQYRIGMLVGALLGYAHVAVMGLLYFVYQNKSLEEEGGSQDRNLESQDYNDDDEEQDAEAQLGNAIGAFCILCLVLIVLYAVFAALVYYNHPSIFTKNNEDMGPNGTRTISPDEHVMTKSIAKAHVLSEAWNAMCILTLVGLSVSLIIAPIPLLQGEEEARREEGANLIWNYMGILLYLLLLMVLLLKMGREVFGQRKMSTQIAIGTMSGFLFYLTTSFFLLAVLFCSFHVGRERRREEEESTTLGSGGFSMMCFFLTGIYGTFAIGVAKHHKAIVRANAKDIYSVEQWRGPFMRAEMV